MEMKRLINKLFFVTLFCLVVVCLSGCRTKEILQPAQTKTETKYIDRVLNHTEYVHDSTLIQTKGDTVFLYKYRTREINTGKDSISYISKTDTIVKPQLVQTTKVTNQLTKWQKFWIDAGYVSGLVILILLIYIFRDPLKLIAKNLMNIIKKLI
jgi:hypothetical protein